MVILFYVLSCDLKMLWLNLFIVLTIVNFSKQYNLTIDFEKIIIPKLYAQHVKKYISRIERTKTTCENHVEHYLDTLINYNNELWAMQMFDAGTKIPSGLLNGKRADFGSFDECLAVETKINNIDVFGKYCLGSIPIINIEKLKTYNFKPHLQSKTVNLDWELEFMLAICMPNSCTAQDIQDIYKKSNLINNIKIFEQFCQTQSDKPEFGYGDIAFVTFIAVILLIMFFSTSYDIFLFYNNKKPKNNILIAFSVLTNGRKLITITNNPNQITCLHGLRVISMMWVILGHRYRTTNMHPVENGLDVLKWMDTVGNMYIMGATVAVDTFLLLSGLVVGYIFFSAMNKGTKFNIMVFYLHRYIRLTPVYAVLIFLHMTVIIHLGSGPYWKYDISKLADECKSNWWASLLYIQNFVNSNGICIGQSWYLSVDTQLYLIAPFVLFPLMKWPNIGIIITSILAFASMIISFIIGYIYELRGFILANKNPHYTRKYYMPTYTRATPWFIGILLGYYIYKIKISNKKIILNKLLVLLIWIVALSILGICVFTGHNTLKDPYDRIANSFYIALMRPGWAVGVSAIILLCELGYGGPVNSFLSAPIFEVLSKLTYTMYLTHMSIQAILVSQNRTVPFHGDLNGLHGYWGDYIFTVAVSLMFTLAFESPIITIEKFIFDSTKTREKISTKNKA